eukprot:TRINITY_DN7366_c0_g1_i1.p1 TRINITY_DN7366_c0_g1~~TRINITY_DN7366_c0_g1_i1.p1  ORF type:complete len:382 (+),score=146.21 TRINITY_DN7366_c0_g1_i1:137-1282(+)
MSQKAANPVKNGDPKAKPAPSQAEIQNLLSARLNELEKSELLAEEDEKNFAASVKRQLKEFKLFLEETLNSNTTKEEKIKVLSGKFGTTIQSNKLLEKELTAKTKKVDELKKEKDIASSDLAKMTSSKVKLENLCRELQKQHKSAIENSKKAAEEESNQRQELSKTFHTKIQEISQKLEDQGDDRMKLLKENDMLRGKIGNFAEQYELREKHFETQLKAKDLEIQLHEAKLSQQNHYSQQSTNQIQLLEDKVVSQAKNEKDLRSQLSLYAEKFEQFQETLTKSNDIFNTFKLEMEKMTKAIKKKDKEVAELKEKCKQTDVALINFAEEKQVTKKQIQQLTTQKKKLEELCRALQGERKATNAPSNNNNASTSSENYEPDVE